MPMDISIPPRIEWEAEQLRITTFHPFDMEMGVLAGWWESVTGDKPEQQVDRPREGIREMFGLFHDKRLVLASQPGRVNVLLLPPDPPLDQEVDGLPTLGPLASALDALHSLRASWLDQELPVTRLAFGAVLVKSVPDLPSGHRVISQFLPFNLDESNVSDFFYQINRPRDSRDAQMRINRLTRWSVAQGGTVSFAIGPNEVTRSYSGAQYACRLELDVNTQADRTTPINDKISLFEEMVGYGMEIAQNGDIP